MPGKWWVGGSFILLASSMGLAQVHVAPPVMPLLPYAACALKISGDCALKALHRSVEVIVDADQTVVMVLGSKSGSAGSAEMVRVDVSEDLERSRLSGELTADDVSGVTADLAKLEGIRYEIPEIERLKSDLGFDKDWPLENEDLRDLVRTHLQLIFGVKPSAAKYFTERMGLESASGFEARVAELSAIGSESAFKPNRN